jgi:hypothetical protein
MARGPLTLDGVPDYLLAEIGLRRGGATEASYRCADSLAVLVPLVEISGPKDRLLNEDRLRDMLRGVHERSPLPPIDVFRGQDAPLATLVHGAHRWRMSLALGYPMIPCRHLTRWEADELGLP